jgi:hypothetical protein
MYPDKPSMYVKLLIVVMALLGSHSAFGHHSFGAEFDENQPVTLEGSVVRFEFLNPHSWIHLDVDDADGNVVRWAVETGSTNALFRRGWRKDSLRAGDRIRIEAFRAKNGTNTANASSVELPDGRLFDAGSSREAN